MGVGKAQPVYTDRGRQISRTPHLPLTAGPRHDELRCDATHGEFAHGLGRESRCRRAGRGNRRRLRRAAFAGARARGDASSIGSAVVAGETSFGNTGIVQSEAVFPYMFPRAPGEIARAALNRDPRVQIRYSALPVDRAVALALFSRLRAERRGMTTRDGDARRWSRAASPSTRLSPRPAGRRRAAAPRRLDQGLPHRARPADGARRHGGD